MSRALAVGDEVLVFGKSRGTIVQFDECSHQLQVQFEVGLVWVHATQVKHASEAQEQW